MRRRAILALACAAALALSTASAAPAAVEFGSDCQADSGGAGAAVSLGHGVGNPRPVTAPVGGIITSWTFNHALGLPAELAGIYAQKLLVMRPAAGLDEFTLVGESALGAPSGPSSTFPTRIPVRSGDHLGLTGATAVLYCATADPGDVIGHNQLQTGIILGATKSFLPEAGNQIPALAAIEPDADGDGYGDETQDGCPQSAAYQTPCPVIVISALGQARRGAAIVHVATDLAAPVSVVGRVGMGKGRKATLRAKARQVAAGRLTRFKLNFPRGLRKRLARLPRGRKLTLRATASAPNIAGGGSVARVKLKLPGTARTR